MSEVLVHVMRNGEVENLHRGDLVVVNLAGEIMYQVGDPYKVTYWRSAAKPFQALPLSEIGGIEKYDFTAEELALMTSSHGGEPLHLEVLHRIFKKMNCDIDLLDCGTAMPMYFPAAVELIKNGVAYTQGHNPCSGKHAAMIALALLKNYDIENYIHKDHPVQKEMLKVIAEMTELEENQIKIGIDGCGVPVFGLPIYNMALAYAKLSKPDHVRPLEKAKRLRQIARAMVENPYYVAGTKRLDTILMEVTKGKIVAKLGAEAVYSIGIMERGIGITLKIESGNYDAIDPVIIELLKKLDFIDQQEFDELTEKCQKIIMNHRKEITGEVKAVY